MKCLDIPTSPFFHLQVNSFCVIIREYGSTLKKLMKIIIIIIIIMNKSQETTVFHGRQKLTSAMKLRLEK